MKRRVHVETVKIGLLNLDPVATHHLRDVLRAAVGDAVELFDTAGRTATGTVVALDPGGVVVKVDAVEPPATRPTLTVAAAVPKGDRADWMVEKLSELGVDHFVPLAADRSVVLPAGRNKSDRWERLAIESAKQSRRAGVMTIGPLTAVADAIVAPGWLLSTGVDAVPANVAIKSRPAILFIGPEGGWTDGEIEMFQSRGLTGVKLTTSVLRVETAAVAAAAVVLSCI